MAFELKVSGNYVVATDTGLAEQLGSFPINHCVYRENDDAFIILEQIDTERVTIMKADVDGGNWVDDQGTPFTQATILTFLQENTGFNTAGGGSPALPYKLYSAYIVDNGSGNAPTITEWYNTFSAITGQASLTNGEIILDNGVGEFLGKTSIIVEIRAEGVNPLDNWTTTAERVDNSTIIIRAFDDNGIQQQFSRFNIEIKEYA